MPPETAEDIDRKKGIAPSMPSADVSPPSPQEIKDKAVSFYNSLKEKLSRKNNTEPDPSES